MKPVFSCLFVLVFFAVSTLTSAQDRLPPDAQAELLRQEIVERLKAEDLEGVLSLLAQHSDLGVDVPPSLHWLEARAAKAEHDHIRAFDALKRFIDSADTSSTEYKMAIRAFDDMRIAASEAWLSKVEPIKPITPARALRRCLEGAVVVRYSTNPDGTVSDASVESSTDPIFERTAIKSVMKSKRAAKIADGVAVAQSDLRVRIRYPLGNDCETS